MRKTGFITGGIFLVIGAFTLFTFVMMWLWNWLMPQIFSLTEVTFWQAAGILVLSKILFSGFGHEHKWHADRKKRIWHKRFNEKMCKMPDDKKEYFLHKMEEKGFDAKNTKNEE